MKIECRHRLYAAVAVAVLGPLATGSAQARVLSQWVELGPDGSSSVRAITDDACPSVLFDGAPTPMAARSAPDQKIENVNPRSSRCGGASSRCPPEPWLRSWAASRCRWRGRTRSAF
jgi:hypothetical protein